MATTITQGAVLKQAGTAIAQVLSISFSVSRGSVDTTTIDLAADAGKTFIPTGLYELGELSMEILYDPALAGHKAILDNLEDGVTDGAIAWQVEIPTGATVGTYTFNGFVTGWDVTLAMDDVTKASVTIKLTDTATAMPTTD